MNSIKGLWYIIVITISFGCNYLDPDEEIPAYIKIDSIIFNEQNSTHKITDVWVNVDGIVVGVFELPAIFPIIAEPGQELQLKAGIKKNGMSQHRMVYPFYNYYFKNEEFSPREIITVNPEFEYIDATEVVWIEDFEIAGHTIVQSSNSDTSIILNSSESKYGNFCGAVYLNPEQNIYEGSYISTFILPQNGSPVFLEMDYKTNHVFIVGIYAREINTVYQEPVLLIAESDDWNKIYVDLTAKVVEFPNAVDYSFYFGIARIENEEPIEAFVDNIKIIRYNE